MITAVGLSLGYIEWKYVRANIPGNGLIPDEVVEAIRYGHTAENLYPVGYAPVIVEYVYQYTDRDGRQELVIGFSWPSDPAVVPPAGRIVEVNKTTFLVKDVSLILEQTVAREPVQYFTVGLVLPEKSEAEESTA